MCRPHTVPSLGPTPCLTSGALATECQLPHDLVNTRFPFLPSPGGPESVIFNTSLLLYSINIFGSL